MNPVRRSKGLCAAEGDDILKVRDILNDGIKRLEAAGIDNAALDARELLKQAYGMDTAELLMNLDRQLCPGAAGGTEPAEITECPGDCGAKLTFASSINMRARRVPLQHILGYAYFMGLEFKVNEHVLIPRQDTEILVETVLTHEKDKEAGLIDMCTGSGCIAVALKSIGGYENVAAADIDKSALNVALRNASINKADIRLFESDLFENIDESFDVVISNPPYIETAVIETLEPEVREHDPRKALDGGTDGLDFYKRIINEAAGTGKAAAYSHEAEKKHADGALRSGGRLYFEIGSEQAEAVTGLMKEAGFTDIQTVRDLAGHDRVVFGKRSF